MDAVTYSKQTVAQAIADHFVAAKLVSTDHRDLTRAFDVRWLPGLVVTDSTRRLHSQTVGFLPEDDLLAELSFGRGSSGSGAVACQNDWDR